MQILFSTKTYKCFKNFQVFHFQFVIFQLASVNVVIIHKEKEKKTGDLRKLSAQNIIFSFFLQICQPRK